MSCPPIGGCIEGFKPPTVVHSGEFPDILKKTVISLITPPMEPLSELMLTEVLLEGCFEVMETNPGVIAASETETQEPEQIEPNLLAALVMQIPQVTYVDGYSGENGYVLESVAQSVHQPKVYYSDKALLKNVSVETADIKSAVTSDSPEDIKLMVKSDEPKNITSEVKSDLQKVQGIVSGCVTEDAEAVKHYQRLALNSIKRFEEQQKPDYAYIEAMQVKNNSGTLNSDFDKTQIKAAIDRGFDQIISKIETAKEGFTVKLHPEGLGEITIKFTSDGQKINASINASHREVSQMMVKELPRLNETLKEMNVFLSWEGSGQLPDRRQSHYQAQFNEPYIEPLNPLPQELIEHTVLVDHHRINTYG